MRSPCALHCLTYMPKPVSMDRFEISLAGVVVKHLMEARLKNRPIPRGDAQAAGHVANGVLLLLSQAPVAFYANRDVLAVREASRVERLPTFFGGIKQPPHFSSDLAISSQCFWQGELLHPPEFKDRVGWIVLLPESHDGDWKPSAIEPRQQYRVLDDQRGKSSGVRSAGVEVSPKPARPELKCELTFLFVKPVSQHWIGSFNSGLEADS